MAIDASLTGRRALVTGASSGIGRATTLALVRAGATVVATGRRSDALTALASECAGAAGRIETIAGDLADWTFVDRLVAAAGDVDILCVNAGGAVYAPFLEITREEIDDMFRINVLSTVHLCQAVARGMAARQRGHIIVMTSIAAKEIFTFGSVYSATKAAMSVIAQSMRLELRAANVKVTEVRTGAVATAVHDRQRHPAVLAWLGKRRFKPMSADQVAAIIVQTLAAPEIVCTDLIELKPLGS